MIPSRLISLKALPLNPHGKVDLKALPKPFQAGALPEVGLSNPVEQVLLNLWVGVFSQGKIGLQLVKFDKHSTIQHIAEFIQSARNNQTASPELVPPDARHTIFKVSGSLNIK